MSVFSRWLSPALVVVVGCASEPQLSDPGPTGRPMVVRLLDASFVEFEGERTTVDEFVYEIRRRCRAAGGVVDRLPWVEVRAPRVERPGTTAVVDAIKLGAYDAGVRHIELVLEDS